MTYYSSTDHYLWVVDTNRYASRFERELCGYCTGETDQSSRGTEAAETFRDEVPENPLLDETKSWSIVTSLPVGDDNVWLSPVTIYPNPCWFNHGRGGVYRCDEPGVEERALLEYRERVAKDAAKNVQNAVHWGWSAEAIERERQQAQQMVDEANQLETVRRYPADLSVAIFLEDRPTDQQIEFLRARARRFVDVYCKADQWLPDDLVIEGFRLIKVRVTETEEQL